jgi:hypothetical protein
MQNLQNGFEARKSERQGNALVPEKPLIILNAVRTWTKENNFIVTGFDYAIKDAGHKSNMSARLLAKLSSHH